MDCVVGIVGAILCAVLASILFCNCVSKYKTTLERKDTYEGRHLDYN